jgi:hypothetical protein
MIAIYAADIGSIKSENFAWARLINKTEQICTDTSIHKLIDNISSDIVQDNLVCLGFECPLFINLPADPILLTSARAGEGARAWSAGAGCGSLATGLAEVLWILSNMQQNSKGKIKPTYKVDALLGGRANLLIWEAFVSSNSKGNSHCDDSIIAVRAFSERLNANSLLTDVSVSNPYSLVGAALLRSEITDDVGFLKEQCIVIKA